MQELIEDLRASLDQMNRSLKQIAENSEQQKEQLEKIIKKLGG